MKIKQDPRKKYIFTGGIAVAVLVLLFGVLSQAGYVFSGPYLVKGGVLKVEQSTPNSNVFVDDRRIGKTNSNGNGEFTGIKLGTQSVLVSHADRWPWVLDVEIESGKETVVRPLQVLEETDGAVLANSDDPLRLRAQSEFATYREPNRIQPLERNNALVWVDGSNIMVQQNQEVRTLFASLHPITNVAWYGDRSDAIIVAVQNNVFALDLRKGSIQNFLPIYTGGSPEAVADPIRSDKLFVRDIGEYFSISI